MRYEAATRFQGYARVIDPVPRHVNQAEALVAQQPDHPLAGCTVGDARALPFDIVGSLEAAPHLLGVSAHLLGVARR